MPWWIFSSFGCRSQRPPTPVRFYWLLSFVLILASNARAESSTMDVVSRPRAIVAGRYVAPDGTIQSDGAIVIQDGVITEVVPSGQLSERDSVVSYPQAVVMPGLIDVYSSVGAWNQIEESALAIDLDASAIDAVDPFHRDFRRVVEAGVTTLVLAPRPNNLASGTAAVLKTHGHSSDWPGVSGPEPIREGPLCFALGPEVYQGDREPTSRMGSVAMLRSLLASASRSDAHPRMKALLEGGMTGLVVCGEAADVSAAVRLMSPIRSQLAIVYSGDEHGLVDQLAEWGRPVILGPFDFRSTARTLSLPAALAAKNVPIAFRGGSPEFSPDAIRITAHLAVRQGLDPSLARRAMAEVPAQIAGVANRVGAIRAGLDADLVVFSDDPLRLDAAVLEVYIAGVRVYSRRSHYPLETLGTAPP